MLYLDQPIGPLRGLMIYRDHEDKGLFYYGKDSPRLSLINGRPEFMFLKYRRDITDNPDFQEGDSLGGGYIAFTVDLGVDEAVLNQVKGDLRKFAEGEVKLAPIPYRDGTVRLSWAKDAAQETPGEGGGEGPEANEPAPPRGMKLFEEIMGTTQPSLMGDNRATFALLVDREAATLLEAGIRTGLSPISVIYSLSFLGLRPAFRVKVTANYKRIYNHLETELGVRGQIQAISLAADIQAAFQKLKDKGEVKVEVMNFTDDSDLKQKADEAWQWFEQKMLNDFFEPALDPPSFMTRTTGGGLGMLGQLQNLFGSLNPPAQTGGTLAPALGAPTTAAPTVAPAPAGLSDNVPPTSQTNQTLAAANAGSGGAHGPSGAAGMAPFQVAFSLKFFHQEEERERVFDYSMQSAVEQKAAPQGMFGSVVDGFALHRMIREVNLDDDFFNRLIVGVSMGADLTNTGISAVAVNLEYPGERKANETAEHVDGFLFRAGEAQTGDGVRTFTTFLNKERDLDYRYQMDVTFTPNSEFVGKDSQVRTGWIVARERQLTLSPLDQVELMDVEIALGDMDTEEIVQVEVELEYDDPGSGFRVEKTVLMKPNNPPVRWKLRLGNDAKREYRFRRRYFFKTGNVQLQTDWETTQDPALIINEPFQGERNVRLFPLLDANNLLEAVVDLDYHEPQTGYRRKFQRVLTGPVLAGQSIVIPTVLPDPAPISFEATIIHADGSVFQSGTITTPDNVALVSEGAGTTQRIRVRLPNNSVGALVAIKVDLTGMGEEPDTTTALFTPSQTADQTVALAQPAANQMRYTYQVTGYDFQGQPIAGATGQTGDQTFIVPLPPGA